jgi:long-chain acyl-CoA synthetase
MQKMQNTHNSFCQLIVDAAESHLDKMAMQIVGEIETRYTFAEMLDQIRSIAYRLEKEGVKFGERVALIGENHPRWAIAYLGILFRGAVCVPIDPHGEIETITNFIQNSEAKLAFIGTDFVESFHKLEEKLGRRIPAVVLQDYESDNGFESFSDWAKTPRPADFDSRPLPVKAEDLAVLIYTSGTTGTPKGVPLTHGNIYYETQGCQEVMNISENEVVLSVLPLFHVFAQVINLWVIASVGSSVYYVKELAPAELTKAFETREITMLTGVPRLWYLFHKKIFDGVAAQPAPVRALFAAMLKTNGFLRDNFNTNLGKKMFAKVHDGFGGNLNITISAGSRFDEKIARDYYALGFTIIQGYGLTETCGAVASTRFEGSSVGSVGTAVNYAEIKLGEPNEDGAGEVLIRGKMVFSGYYKNPEATREAFTEDGWFKSGDLGKIDQNGELFIVGRSKDVIVLPNGKNIHPEDLEVKYAKSPLVEELAILGIKDTSSNLAGAEKLVAVVVPDFAYLKANNIANSKEAIRYAFDNLGRELPEYQRVREYVIHTEPLPRTATRKVKRFELLKQIEKEGLIDQTARPKKQTELSAEDKTLLNTNAGRAVVSAIKKNVKDVEIVSPAMNLEIDFGLDSLSRAEVFAALEQAFATEFDGDEAAQALTVADTIRLVQKHVGDGENQIDVTTDLNWGKIVREAEADFPEVQGVLQNRPIFRGFAFVVYRIFNFFCRAFLSLEVTNLAALEKMKRPFLVCPNHQSFLDPFVLTSNYPFEIFQNIFHVGASQFFRSGFMQWVAKMLSVVPIDADTQLMKAMKAGAVGLKNGKVLNIYPEGERAFDGELHDFKKGAAILASELDLPILPVAIDGLYKVWARGTLQIRRAKVKIRFGEPFYARDIIAADTPDEEKYAAITAHLKEKIRLMIEEMRA